MIQRDYYLDKIKARMWDGNIKVITGIRRCGKSTLLFDLFRNHLLSIGVDEDHILEYELDKRKYYSYRNPVLLCDEIEKKIESHKDEKFYLFIDEVQLTVSIKDKESGIDVTIYDMLNELRDYKNLDCYVTGSNSKALSSDIATEFRGRSSQIRIYPLSFQEFYSCHKGDFSSALNEYMLYGGMPGLVNETTDENKKQYLKNLYDEIYMKDLVEHGKIKREDILGEMLDELASQIGSLTNANRITDVINAHSSFKVDVGMIIRYLRQIQDAFLVHEVKRYDIKGNKYFDYPNKYYYTDPGLRNIRLNYRQIDSGHLMENMIYNELLRRDYSVDVGVIEDRRNAQTKQKEIDFVVNHFDKKIYIQSSLRMEENEKANAELDSLRLTHDFFRKIIIRNDIPASFYDKSGIFHMTLEDFLLEKTELF